MLFGNHPGEHVPSGSPRETAAAPRPKQPWSAAHYLRWARWIGTSLALSTLVVGLLLIATTITFPNPMKLGIQERGPVIRILSADGKVLAERAGYDYMPIDLLPQHVIDAVISTEDRRFFDHHGLDPVGLFRAMFRNLRAGRYAQGGSTLTQQLAKNLFLSSDRRLLRKLQELYYAVWLEIRLSKKDILELYLNKVFFGSGATGIEAAAQRYFDKSARDLDFAEAAVLAGVLKAPSKFSPLANPPLARARARVVIENMRQTGRLTDEQARQASNEVITFKSPAKERDLTGYEYATEHVFDRLPSLARSNEPEIIVETTIDPSIQRDAQKKLTALIQSQGTASGVSQGAMLVLSPDGAIRAMIGGVNFAQSRFNRATRARRQPGSTFKPFVYLAALESGMTPSTIVYDLPISVKNWSPRNDHGSYRGPMTMRQALAESVNTVAVRLHLDMGMGKTAEVAARLGVQSDLNDNPSLALGTSEVNLMEMVGAYSAFANGGFRVEPHIIERVRTGTGVILFQRALHVPTRVIADRPLGQMNDMLQTTLTSGTGRRAAIAQHPAAGKTGTSQYFHDAWFIGYTRHLVAGVWLGNDDGHSMNRIMGGSMPARLWHDVMGPAHEGLKPEPLLLADDQPPMPAASQTRTASPRLPSGPIDQSMFSRAIAANR